LKNNPFLDNAVLANSLLLVKYDYKELYKTQLSEFCIEYLSPDMIRYLNYKLIEVDFGGGGELYISYYLNIAYGFIKRVAILELEDVMDSILFDYHDEYRCQLFETNPLEIICKYSSPQFASKFISQNSGKARGNCYFPVNSMKVFETLSNTGCEFKANRDEYSPEVYKAILRRNYVCRPNVVDIELYLNMC